MRWEGEGGLCSHLLGQEEQLVRLVKRTICPS